MRHPRLEDALEFVILYGEAVGGKFERAACRWLGRLIVERGSLKLHEAQLAAAALGAPKDAPLTGATTLRSIASWAAG